MQKTRQGDLLVPNLVPDLFLFFKKALYEVKAKGLQLSFNIFDGPQLVCMIFKKNVFHVIFY